MTTPSQQKWLTKLPGLDYSIEYKNGVTNVAADALFRVRDPILHNITVSVTMLDFMKEIEASWSLPSGYGKVITELHKEKHWVSLLRLIGI